MYLNLSSVQMTFYISILIMWPEHFCLDLQILAHLIDVPAHGRGVVLNDL